MRTHSMARVLVLCALTLLNISSGAAAAQPVDRDLDMNAQVLDALFAVDVTPKTYFLKMVLRFGDSNTQLTVVVYPGKKSEIIRHRLVGIDGDDLARLISRTVADNPRAKVQELAATLKVEVTRIPLDYDAVLRPYVDELRSIRISPVPQSRVAVDQYFTYEFWYDTGQEAVRYTIVGSFESESQDELRKWMFRFRAGLDNTLKGSLPTKP